MIGLHNVLIVDDNPSHARSIRDALEREPEEGFRVVIVDRCAQGVEQLKRSKLALSDPLYVDYAAVIVDLSFPTEGVARGVGGGMNTLGMEVYREALKYPLVEPIIITAHANVMTAVEGVNGGLFRYIQKDHNTAENALIAVRKAVVVRSCILSMQKRIEGIELILQKELAAGGKEMYYNEARAELKELKKELDGYVITRGKTRWLSSMEK